MPLIQSYEVGGGSSWGSGADWALERGFCGLLDGFSVPGPDLMESFCSMASSLVMVSESSLITFESIVDRSSSLSILLAINLICARVLLTMSSRKSSVGFLRASKVNLRSSASCLRVSTALTANSFAFSLVKKGAFISCEIMQGVMGSKLGK